MAVIELHPGRYTSFIAYVYGANERDWLATGYRDGDGPWRAKYRFRYYAEGPGDPWDERDERSVYEVELSAGETEEKLVTVVRAMAMGLIEKGFSDRLDWLDVRSSDPKVGMALLETRPWAHVKRGSPSGDA